jgi:hypothetical protein
MGLIAKATGGAGHDPIPAGTYTAICYAVVDLGTHHMEAYNKDARKVLIMWEIPDVTIEVEREGRAVEMPRAISKRYTMSLHKKASLRADLQAWRGRAFTEEELAGFDLKAILGAPCLLGIVHEQRRDGQGVYATISSIMALPRVKGATAAKPVPANDLVAFEIPDGADPGFDIDPRLPDWVQESIRESREYTGDWPEAVAPIQHPELIEGKDGAGEPGDEALPF